jgi:hypothetical protein
MPEHDLDVSTMQPGPLPWKYQLALIDLFDLNLKDTAYLAACACRSVAPDPAVLQKVCDNLARMQGVMVDLRGWVGGAPVGRVQ